MIDRELILKDRDVLAMLKKEFVPIAIDQWYTRSQRDDEGDFYRRIIRDSPRSDPKKTTQGFYVASPGGQLIGYNNNRTADRVRKFMQNALRQKASMTAKPLLMEQVDAKRHHELPDGAVVARVNSKVLSGYKKSQRSFSEVFQNATGRDNLWITAEEQSSLANGAVSDSLSRKIARFYLVDNTRGEPPMWKADEIQSLDVELDDNGVVTGNVQLETADGKRGYVAALRGFVEFEGKDSAKKLSRFDLVAKGKFWGTGPYTKRGPAGKFDFAVAIRLADGTDVSDSVLPQALKAAGLDAYRKP